MRGRLVAAIGACGSGKTYLLDRLTRRTLAKTGWRFLRLDLNNEAPGEHTRGVRHAFAEGPEGARAMLARGHRLVIVRPPLAARSSAHHDPRPWAGLVDELAALAIDGPPTILVVPEAHTSLREGYPLTPAVSTIVHRYRHPSVQAGLWVDTQHFRDLHKEALNEVHPLYLFATGSPRDRAAIRKYGGPELVAAVGEAGRRLAEGQPGWHVRITPMHVVPPFELRR